MRPSGARLGERRPPTFCACQLTSPRLFVTMLRVHPMIVKTSVLLIGLLVPLLLFEGLLRLTTSETFGSPPQSCGEATYHMFGLIFDPVFGWRNAPGSWNERCDSNEGARTEDVYVNQLGFRGPEIELRKKPGVLRIVCLGDSGTFGVQATHSEAGSPKRVWRVIENYPDELARRLELAGFDRVEVINAGVIGYGSSQILRLLALRIMDLEPDIVTARFAANDTVRSWAPQRRTVEPANPVARAILYAFHDWRLMRLSLRAYQSVPGVHPKPDSVLWTSPDQFRRNVERIADVTRKHDVPLLLIDYPLGNLAWLENPAKSNPLMVAITNRLPERLAILREVAAANSIPMLTTQPSLNGSEGQFYDKSDLVHPNPRGAQRIGRLLFAKLRALGWLGSPVAGVPGGESP